MTIWQSIYDSSGNTISTIRLSNRLDPDADPDHTTSEMIAGNDETVIETIRIHVEDNRIRGTMTRETTKGQAFTADDQSVIGPGQRNTTRVSVKDFGHAFSPVKYTHSTQRLNRSHIRRDLLRRAFRIRKKHQI